MLHTTNKTNQITNICIWNSSKLYIAQPRQLDFMFKINRIGPRADRFVHTLLLPCVMRLELIKTPASSSPYGYKTRKRIYYKSNFAHRHFSLGWCATISKLISIGSWQTCPTKSTLSLVTAVDVRTCGNCLICASGSVPIIERWVLIRTPRDRYTNSLSPHNTQHSRFLIANADNTHFIIATFDTATLHNPQYASWHLRAAHLTPSLVCVFVYTKCDCCCGYTIVYTAMVLVWLLPVDSPPSLLWWFENALCIWHRYYSISIHRHSNHVGISQI